MVSVLASAHFLFSNHSIDVDAFRQRPRTQPGCGQQKKHLSHAHTHLSELN